MKTINLVKRAQRGFTLIELMIVVAIIGILAAVGVPSYNTYTKKAKFAEVVQAVANVKSLVDICFGEQATYTSCVSSSNGVPAAVTAAVGSSKLASLVVTSGSSVAATITGTAIGTGGLSGETYILTTDNSGSSWVKTGGCTTVSPAIC